MFIIHRQLLYSFFFSGVFYIFNALFFAIDGAPGDHLYFMNHVFFSYFTPILNYFWNTDFGDFRLDVFYEKNFYLNI